MSLTPSASTQPYKALYESLSGGSDPLMVTWLAFVFQLGSSAAIAARRYHADSDARKRLWAVYGLANEVARAAIQGGFTAEVEQAKEVVRLARFGPRQDPAWKAVSRDG